jgi:hypothetical protein
MEYDVNNNPLSMSPIPGGPAAAEAEQLATTQENLREGEAQRADIVTQDIDRILEKMGGGILPDTGWGAVLSKVPGTDAKAISSLLDTVKANIGFQELNKMRQQSPTGGALGQVSEREINFLQSVAGSLDQAQDKAELTDNLNRLWNTYQDVIHGPGDGPQRRPLAFQEQEQPSSSGPEVGTIDNGWRFKGGDPADPNNWERIT